MALREWIAARHGATAANVLVTTGSQQALDLFTEHSGTIAVVVTDVVMPRMGGIELAERLRQSNPNLPILFVTGYVEQSDALQESAAGTPVLLKPFSPEALLRAVSSAIQSTRK